MGISMFLVMTSTAFAKDIQKEEVLQPGWIKVNSNHYENPTTGEYFRIRYNLSRASSDSVSFDFKIRYSFQCPTKFKAPSTSATVSAYADVEEYNGKTNNSKSYGYRVTVGSKKANFTTGKSADKKISSLKKGKSYTVTVSTTENTESDYVVGNVTVE